MGNCGIPIHTTSFTCSQDGHCKEHDRAPHCMLARVSRLLWKQRKRIICLPLTVWTCPLCCVEREINIQRKSPCKTSSHRGCLWSQCLRILDSMSHCHDLFEAFGLAFCIVFCNLGWFQIAAQDAYLATGLRCAPVH
eukprot:6427552-Amphidinium_carterae.1